MTYNHAYTIGFAVPESEYEDWEDCLRHEKAKVISAMIKRIWLVMDNDQEFMEALDGFDTFEE
jgi:hypothetical protein